MAQTKGKRKKTQGRSSKAEREKLPRRREIGAGVFFLLAIFSLIGYFGSDGVFVGILAGLIKGLTGPGFYVTAPVFILASVILVFHRGRPVRFRVICTLLLVVFTGAAWHLFFCGLVYEMSFSMIRDLWLDGREVLSGGVICGTLAEIFKYLFSRVGATIIVVCGIVMLIMGAFRVSPAAIADYLRSRERREYIPEPEPERKQRVPETPMPRRQEPERVEKRDIKRKKQIDIPLDGEETQDKPVKPEQPAFYDNEPKVKTPDRLIMEYAAVETASDVSEYEADADITDESEVDTQDIEIGIPFMEKSSMPQAAEQAVRVTQKSKKEEVPFNPEFIDGTAVEYAFPPLDLLAAAEGGVIDGTEEVRINSARLETAFSSFGVSVKISNATRGPSVTRYEAELEAGIKLSKLTSLADDIALSLGTSGVRIAAMPNKMSTVGIEVPNKLISRVLLREIIESSEFTRASSKLTFAIGMNISGEAVVGNISKLPHMLVAGTTGSGKSVCLNSIILSILYKATPEDVRLIMIDPKMVEFRVYNSIPHLLIPVVTDVKKAAGALQWAVVEMMRRYRLFSESNARDLSGFNALAAKSEELETMPQIVVIIDELADLMMQAAKEVEESICRVAQMGRAAGVHLIIATQSPRADVITGLMKANIPSRIALKVSSALESRIILDAGGAADKLVGNGDMLYAPIGTTKPVRIQGTWVSDEEREDVVEYIKRSGVADYSQDVITEIEKTAAGKLGVGKDKDESEEAAENDEMLPQAVEVILETNQASVSMLQRRLKLGYARAARIVDQMEQMGIVGPYEGSKPRAILITREQWQEMQYVQK